MWADRQDEARSPYQLWGYVDDDDLPLVPPPRTLQVLATPTKRVLGQRGSPLQDAYPKQLEAAGFSTSSSSNTRGSESSRLFAEKEFAEVRGGNKAQTEPYQGFKVESGDLRSLRNFKGQTTSDSLADVGGNGHLKFRNNESSSLSVMSSPDADSVTPEGWSRKPKDAAYAALRYLGLVPSSKGHPSKPAAMKTSSIVVCDPEGRTALILAAKSGHLKACEVLISARADVEATDVYDKTPLAYAAAAQYTEIASLLLDHGAEVEATDCIVRDVGCSLL